MNIKKKSMPIIGALFIMLAAAMWGADGILLRPNLYHLDVPVVVFLEHFLAFILMSGFLIYEFKELKKLNKSDWLSFFWIALFGGAIGTMAITKALFYVNFEHLSVIIILQKLQPLFAIILSIIILKEKPQKKFYIYALFAIIGSYLITFGFTTPVITGNKLFIASLLSLLAAFSWGSATVFGKKVVTKINFRVATYIRFGLTSIIMFIIITVLNRFSNFNDIGKAELTTILIIIFTSGGLAIFIYYYGLRWIMASKATIYELAFPITAVLLDYFIHNNTLSIGQWIGTIIIIISMIKITTMNSFKKNTQ